MMLPWMRVSGVAFVVCACAGDPPPPPGVADEPDVVTAPPTSPLIQLIDSTIPPAVAGEAGWDYHQSVEVDLTGDGQPERVVLTARVEMVRGQPAWDDGQPWQVYIEAPGGGRTYLYAQRLQLGTLTMEVGRSDAGLPATVVLLEQLPEQLSLYEASYLGPDRVSVAVRFRRDLEVPGG